jgi:hypothetical protein
VTTDGESMGRKLVVRGILRIRPILYEQEDVDEEFRGEPTDGNQIISESFQVKQLCF